MMMNQLMNMVCCLHAKVYVHHTLFLLQDNPFLITLVGTRSDLLTNSPGVHFRPPSVIALTISSVARLSSSLRRKVVLAS